MNEITIYENAEFGRIRTLVVNEQPWFVGKDVAAVLGYSNSWDALKKHVDADDKQTSQIAMAGQHYNMNIINESGLYSLVLASKLPSAKRFKHWVTSEVLPQIRMTGGYIPISRPSKSPCLGGLPNEQGGLSDEQGNQATAKSLPKQGGLVGPKGGFEGLDDDNTIMMKAMAVAQKTIDMKNRLIGDLRPKANYCEKVLLSPSCFTMTQIAKDLSMTVIELEHRLHAMGIIYRSQSGPYMLYAKHLGKGYEAYRTIHGKDLKDGNGFEWTGAYLVWTEKGREFIHAILGLSGAHICKADEMKN